MSNTKELIVQGTMPFCLLSDYENQPSERLWKFFAMMSMPTWNIEIEYGSKSYVPNDHGGETCMYEFTIFGTEAFNLENATECVKEMIKLGARITQYHVNDLDAPAFMDLLKEVI